MVSLGLVLATVLVALVFDWNWFRGPLETYVSKRTHRAFTASEFHVRLGLTPTIRLRNVTFANAPWAAQPAVAKIGLLEFSISLRDLCNGSVLLPRIALTDADLHLEQLEDKRNNWKLSDPSDRTPSKLRIGSLSITRGHLDYFDRGIALQLAVDASTFDSALSAKASEANAPPINRKYATRYAFSGTYHDAKFAGDALTGEVLSFQETSVPFSIKGRILAGSTSLDVEGTIADAANISAIDVQMRIAGQTLANLYPFLALPLPASPPYRLTGHLTQTGHRYEIEALKGQIGSTDVSGSAAYFQQSPRPLLQATLHSRLLKIADLGPLVGVTTKAGGSAIPTQATTNDRHAAKNVAGQTNGDRILPSNISGGERLLPNGKFEGGRLKIIDATGEYTADRVEAPGHLSVQDVQVGVVLKDAVLALDPVKVGVAQGTLDARIGLDARQPKLKATMEVAARRLHLAELIPSAYAIARSHGSVGGFLNLRGAGDSVADLAAKSDGQISIAMSSARISNLLDAAAGLNGGKVMQLLIAGDKDIAVRCGAAAFDVKAGHGISRLFVIDTDQTRVNGAGGFDLDTEKFDLKIEPEPKHASLLSLRTPLRLYGTFKHPQYELDKKGLAMRAGGTIALAFVAPWTALIPLIETGPGTDADCARLTTATSLGPRPVKAPT